MKKEDRMRLALKNKDEGNDSSQQFDIVWLYHKVTGWIEDSLIGHSGHSGYTPEDMFKAQKFDDVRKSVIVRCCRLVAAAFQRAQPQWYFLTKLSHSISFALSFSPYFSIIYIILYCALLCTIFKLNFFNSWKQTKVQTRILLPKTSEAVRRYKKAIEHAPGIAWHRGLSNGAETTSRPNPQPSQWLWG